jgi:hypothetical protein
MEQTVTSDFAARLGEDIVDLEDLDAVLQLHRLKVFRFILVSLRDAEAAERSRQECFLKAYQTRAGAGPTIA